jgi:3-carboxy-cis,cis-muconate cycloisomerase
MIKALAKKVRSNCAGFSEIYMRELRDHSPFYLQDLVIPETTLLADTILEQAKFVLGGLKVKPENMLKNLRISGGSLLTEALMLALARETGKKETGFHLVHKAAMESYEKGEDFTEYAAKLKDIRQYFDEDRIRGILDPANYLGLNDRLIDQVIKGEIS